MMPIPNTTAMKRPRITILPWIATFSFLALTGCFGHKKLTQEASCQEKWDKIKVKFDKKRYADVKEPLAELVSSCPGSIFTEEALFDLGEVHFRLEEWIEAETEFGSFLKDFPASKKYTELVRWRMAEAASKQVEPPNRDQTKTLEAIQSYETFLDEYSDSKYADTAKTQLDKLKDQLVTKQMQIAHLYRRMDEPLAAVIYYKNMLKVFGTRVNQRDVNLNLAECYIELNQFDEAEVFLAKFDGIAKDDPFRDKIKKAYEDLSKARRAVDREKKEEKDLVKRQEPM